MWKEVTYQLIFFKILPSLTTPKKVQEQQTFGVRI